eukprot:TRINITY_DN59740_c0_g1_i1.p1 TRINITY_DN59740_c0_g1~~TRINITY_DN59740_c0_g1_i1.p1  ORF type:complete len:111 (-),score=33.12 TRINITY_DN59740_c0_g1_i1:68-400(-)
MSRRRGRKNKEENVGPDPLLQAEERLSTVLEHVAQRLMEAAPDPEKPHEIPLAALEALCELHPEYKEQAQYARLKVEEQKLKIEVKKAQDAKTLAMTRPTRHKSTTKLQG